MNATLTRSDLVAGAFGTLIGGVALDPRVANAAPAPNVLAGVVEQIVEPNALTLRRRDAPPVRVGFESDALFWRDLPVALNAFRIGDEVVAEGDWAGDTFRSKYMVPLLRVLTGTIVGKSGETLIVDAEQVRFTPFTKLREGNLLRPVGLDSLQIGTIVDVFTRLDPERQDKVAVAVFPS